MFRSLSILILLLIPMHSMASSSYTVNIAIYKNVNTLNHKLKKLSPALRKTVEVKKIKKRHIATTLPTKNKALLETLLPAYRKVFSDAFISVAPRSTTPRALQKLTPVKSSKVTKTTPKTLLSSNKFQDKTYYLSSKASHQSNNILIKVIFTNNTVKHIPIIGNIPPITARYKVTNNKLYMYQKGLFNPKVYNILEKSFEDYHLVSSWIGSKKINNVRYYFTLENAKQYLK